MGLGSALLEIAAVRSSAGFHRRPFAGKTLASKRVEVPIP